MVPPFVTAIAVDDSTTVFWSSADFGFEGALLITDISLFQLLLSDDGLLQPLLKGFSDSLATSGIDLGLKLPFLAVFYLRIQSFLFDFCLFVQSGKMIELVLICVSILRDEVASVIRKWFTLD